MSIKEIIHKELCYICTLKNCTGKCEDVVRESTKITQQIISEIVGELEKLQEPLTSESEQSDYENVYAVNRCIETIKKMGEV